MAATEQKSANELAGERTDLASERTILAADRTLMAWVRTALSLIGFGFTIYRVLQQFQSEVAHVIRPHGPRNLGLLLIFLGSWGLAMGMSHYVAILRKLGRRRKQIFASSDFILAGVLALLGAFLFVSIVVRVEVF